MESIMNNIVAERAAALGCTVINEALLKNYTTFRVGGKCGMIKLNGAASCGELVKLMNELGEEFIVLGKGSNVIADDNGTEKIVLLIGDEMSDIDIEDDIIRCGAGASLTAVCRAALKSELTGLEFAYGIPGSVGGGVYMNAGAYGGEIKDIILYAEAVSRSDGSVRRFSPEEMELSYRHSRFMQDDHIITSAAFKLAHGNADEIKARMNELMDKRRTKQPLEYPSAGSTFKRPEGSYASLLIEQCGLKGMSVGGAEVSTKHSGFIINKGGATSADILTLIEKVREIVKEKTGYELECEPVVIGK